MLPLKVKRSYSLRYPSDVDFSPDSRLIALGSWEAGEIRPFQSGLQQNIEASGEVKGSNPRGN
jgi:hypothetical protein